MLSIFSLSLVLNNISTGYRILEWYSLPHLSLLPPLLTHWRYSNVSWLSLLLLWSQLQSQFWSFGAFLFWLLLRFPLCVCVFSVLLGMMYLDVVFFLCFLLRIYLSSWICGLMSLIGLQLFSATLFLRYCLQHILSLLFFWSSDKTFIIPSQHIL